MNKTTVGFPLTSAMWISPPMHVPDAVEGAYKTELVVFRDPKMELGQLDSSGNLVSVVKINWWHSADPRRDPHSHPWSFNSTILSGGYTETRYWIDQEVVLPDASPKLVVRSETKAYRVGDINHMPSGVFHTVDSVEPGTVTKMECGPLIDNGFWGYLNIETGEITKALPDSTFMERARAINPHMRPK